MRKTKKLVSTAIIVVVVCLTGFNVLAQSEVKKYFDKNGKEKIVKNIKKGVGNFYSRDDGMGMGPYLTSFDEIPKIGIAAFNVNSQGYKHTHKSTYYTQSYSKDLSSKQGNAIANIIHYGAKENGNKGAFVNMESVFGSKGIKLMTPYHFLANAAYLENSEDEYIIDNAKMNYYFNFEPEKTKVFGKILSRGTAESYAQGYAPLILSEAVTADWKTKNSYGYDLTEKMGVTAMMLVEIDLVVEKKYVGLKSIRVAVVGRNPTPFVEGKKYITQIGGYPKGQVYFDSKLDFGDKGLSFIKLKGENVVEESFDGFDEIMECFAQAMTEYWEDMIKKHTK
jgi:hypothetical protein